MEDLVSSLRQLLIDDLYIELPPDQIGLDDGLRTIVGLDSIGFVELRVLCEQRFNIEINDDDYTPDNFDSVRHLAALIQKLKSADTVTA